jgi:hypothetical protein
VPAGDHVEPLFMRLDAYCPRSPGAGQGRLRAPGRAGQGGRDRVSLQAPRAFNKTENRNMRTGDRPQPRAGPRLRLVLRPGLCTLVPGGTWEGHLALRSRVESSLFARIAGRGSLARQFIAGNRKNRVCLGSPRRVRRVVRNAAATRQARTASRLPTAPRKVCVAFGGAVSRGDGLSWF